jgi:hypothetical protein
MDSRRDGIAIAAALLAAAGAAACSVQEVPVAREIPGGGSEIPCSDSMECGPVAYCAKPSCSASQGRCELRPVECGEDAGTTCGCDGVNYWNDCLRRQNGVAFSAAGECTTTFASCGGFHGMGCPAAGAFCARLGLTGNGSCDPGVPGVCWVLPTRCPLDDGGQLWESCGSRPPICAGICEAIRAERPYRVPFDPTACP